MSTPDKIDSDFSSDPWITQFNESPFDASAWEIDEDLFRGTSEFEAEVEDEEPLAPLSADLFPPLIDNSISYSSTYRFSSSSYQCPSSTSVDVSSIPSYDTFAANINDTHSDVNTLDLVMAPLLKEEDGDVLADHWHILSTIGYLDLEFNSLPNVRVLPLVKSLGANTSLGGILLRNYPMTEGVRFSLVESLRTNSTLTYLWLWNSTFGAGGGMAMADLLRSNSTLTSLDLRNNSIGKQAGVVMADALRSNSTLKCLILSWNNLEEEGGIALAECLRYNSTLTELNLDNNSLGPKGAIAIANALQSNTTLTALNLWNNSIEDAGAIALAKVLHTNSTLAYLNLWNNSIGPDGGCALAESLYVNSTLTSLNLAGSMLKRTGPTIARSLRFNSGLTSLNLHSTFIGTKGMRAMAKSLLTNTTLVCLDLTHCNLAHGGKEESFPLANALYFNSTLNSLNLSCNLLPAAAFPIIEGALATNHTLAHLDLSSTSPRKLKYSHLMNHEHKIYKNQTLYQLLLVFLYNF